MTSLPISATDDEIKWLVVQWSELLAEERFSDALLLLPHSREEHDWTPDLLRSVIRGYGVPDPDPQAMAYMLAEYEVDAFRVTSLVKRDDFEEILTEHIDVDRQHLFGLDPARYLGMVHYRDLPLNGYRSDLTARFHIMRVGGDRLILEFLDLHVM